MIAWMRHHRLSTRALLNLSFMTNNTTQFAQVQYLELDVKSYNRIEDLRHGRY